MKLNDLIEQTNSAAFSNNAPDGLPDHLKAKWKSWDLKTRNRILTNIVIGSAEKAAKKNKEMTAKTAAFITRAKARENPPKKLQPRERTFRDNID